MGGNVPKISPDTPRFLDGFPSLEQFARETGKHPRTVRRWTQEANGLPYVLIGRAVHIPLEGARQWLISRIQHPNPRRAR